MLDRKSREDSSFKTTLQLLTWQLFLLLTFSLFLFTLLAMDWTGWIQITGMLIAFLLMILAVLTLMGIVVMRRIWYNQNVPKGLAFFSLSLFFQLAPVIEQMGRWLGKDPNEIRQACTRLNNIRVLWHHHPVSPEEMLVLLPHCLQWAECGIRITHEPRLCQRCGQCSLAALVELQEQYRFKMMIATGGTVARQHILNLNPSFILAVACERDLMSGLLDVRHIPVYGLLNERPQGPCYNTRVDVNEMDRILNRLIER